jgi:hypothetical protein
VPADVYSIFENVSPVGDPRAVHPLSVESLPYYRP